MNYDSRDYRAWGFHEDASRRDDGSWQYGHEGEDEIFNWQNRGFGFENLPNRVVFIPKIEGSLKLRRTGTKGNKSVLIDDDERKAVERRNAFYEELGARTDSYYVIVGVLDGEKQHRNANGKGSVSYETLFELLKTYNYDPLLPIRIKSFVDGMERKMGDVILKCWNSPSKTVSSKSHIIGKLSTIAKSIVDYVQAYIAGGNKPSLKDRTVKNRRYKEEHYDSATYPNGIEEPLSETGQLEDAIEFMVGGERSAFQDKYRDYIARQRRLSRTRKAQRATAKAEKKARELTESAKRRSESILSDKEKRSDEADLWAKSAEKKQKAKAAKAASKPLTKDAIWEAMKKKIFMVKDTRQRGLLYIVKFHEMFPGLEFFKTRDEGGEKYYKYIEEWDKLEEMARYDANLREARKWQFDRYNEVYAMHEMAGFIDIDDSAIDEAKRIAESKGIAEF